MGIRRFFERGYRTARGSARDFTAPGDPEATEETIARLCERVEALEADNIRLARALFDCGPIGARVVADSVATAIAHRQRHDHLSAEDAYASERAEEG